MKHYCKVMSHCSFKSVPLQNDNKNKFPSISLILYTRCDASAEVNSPGLSVQQDTISSSSMTYLCDLRPTLGFTRTSCLLYIMVQLTCAIFQDMKKFFV